MGVLGAQRRWKSPPIVILNVSPPINKITSMHRAASEGWSDRVSRSREPADVASHYYYAWCLSVHEHPFWFFCFPSSSYVRRPILTKFFLHTPLMGVGGVVDLDFLILSKKTFFTKKWHFCNFFFSIFSNFFFLLENVWWVYGNV